MSVSAKDPTAAADEAEEAVPERRARMGRYLELQLLGHGGMGAVYRGYDPSLERQVAIKMIRDRTPTFLSRFRREARAMARLSHPSVAQIYDFGEDEDSGEPYFVMEYVSGPPLDALLADSGPMAPKDVVRILRQAAAGLSAAHGAGIIHRDIKPSNLILDPEGQLKIVDFGIARMEEGTSALTRPQSFLGTPHYMAPEALAGRTVDGRADIYALGLTAFHLLTGRPPFDAPSAGAVALKQMSEDLPDLATLSPRAGKGLCQLIAHMAEKDPAARVQSCDDLLRDLAALDPAPTGSTGPGAAPRSSPGARRILRPLPLVLACGLGALLLGTAALRWHAGTEKPAPVDERIGKVSPAPEKAGAPRKGGEPARVAVLPFKNLGADPSLDFMAEGLAETILVKLGQDGVRLLERTQVDKALQEIDFGQSRYVDQATRVALGHIKGVELAVQGGFQKSGGELRVTARLVRIETGEILDTLVRTRPAAAPFALQDLVAKDLAAQLKAQR